MYFSNQTIEAKIEIKKSTFIGYLCAYESFDLLIKKLRQDHPKARHIVWAYRYLNEFDQVVENSSDDGEPKGTSGPPVLSVMRGAELIESAILVVRYFGGIKLGTGGLVRAYSSAAKQLIEKADLQVYEKKGIYFVTIPYALHPRFEHYLQKSSLDVKQTQFEALHVKVMLSLSDEEWSGFLDFANPFAHEGVSVEAL